MSKRKKRSTRVTEVAATRPVPPETAEFAPQPAARPPRRNLPALMIAGTLWVGWFIFLAWVAATRK